MQGGDTSNGDGLWHAGAAANRSSERGNGVILTNLENCRSDADCIDMESCNISAAAKKLSGAGCKPVPTTTKDQFFFKICGPLLKLCP